MRRVWLLGLFAMVGLFISCSDGDSEKSCTVATDCSAANTCLDGKCKQIECSAHADCPGLTPFCGPVGIDPANPDKRYCSPVMCTADTECDAGMVCDTSTKQCIVGGNTSDVASDLDTGNNGDKDVVEDLDDEDIAVVTEEGICAACTSDAECADGKKCHPLGGGTFCFATCATSNDCATGWMCYAVTADGKQCIPMAFNCDADCLTAGCPDGQMCNQQSGQCAAGASECAACQNDWNCAEGYRCNQDGGYCAPECGAGCPTNSTCQEVNETAPVSVCVSASPECCYGDTCDDACSAEKPYLKDGKCVECLNDGHCSGEEVCTAAGACGSATCTDPNAPYEKDGGCVQCLNDDHCVGFGDGDTTYLCKNNVCTPDELPPECAYCTDPYPACVQINGVWSCVQCTADTDCGGSDECDLSMYTCTGDGPPNCSGCQSDAECVSSTGSFELECDNASGCCIDKAGWCDGVEAFCPAGECKGLMDILGGGMGMGGIPGMPTEGSFGACACTTPMDMMSLAMCLMAPCDSAECPGSSVCIDPAILTDLLGGGLPSGDAAGYCINLSSLLGGLF